MIDDETIEKIGLCDDLVGVVDELGINLKLMDREGHRKNYEQQGENRYSKGLLEEQPKESVSHREILQTPDSARPSVIRATPQDWIMTDLPVAFHSLGRRPQDEV